MVSQKIGAHVRSNVDNFICLRQLIGSRSVKNRKFLRRDLFFFMRAQHVLNNHLIRRSTFCLPVDFTGAKTARPWEGLTF